MTEVRLENQTWQDKSSNATSPSSSFNYNVWIWRNVLFGAGGASIACVGLVCNFITIVVLSKYNKSQVRSSAPILLICLEVFGSVYLFSELFLENLTYLSQGGLITKKYRTFILPVYCQTFVVPPIAWTSATFLVVVISVERYVVVARPLSAHALCCPAKAKVSALLVLLVSCLYHLPLYLAYTCPRVWSNKTQTYLTRFVRTEFGSSYYFINVHMTWLKLTVNFLLPFVLLTTFNVLLLRVLWRSRTALFETKQAGVRHEKRLTIMVVSMTCVFFLCELMSATSHILASGLNKYTECSGPCVRFTAVADTFVMINAATNFAIYCASGRKFRDIFVQTFLWWRLRNRLSAATRSSVRSHSSIRTRLSSFLSRGLHPGHSKSGSTDLMTLKTWTSQSESLILRSTAEENHRNDKRVELCENVKELPR